MANTALQMLIEQWGKEYNNIDSSENQRNYIAKGELKLKIHQARLMLDKERQQIEEAFKSGQKEGFRCFNKKTDPLDPNSYYRYMYK